MEKADSILFENKSIEISWDAASSILQVTFKAYATNQGYLDILKKLLVLAKEKRATGTLFDLRRMGVVNKENQEYTAKQFFPAMAAAGIAKGAVLMPTGIFGRASVDMILEGHKSNSPLAISVFPALDEAINWLGE